MGATAEFFGIFAKFNDTDGVAILLGEFHLSAFLFGFFDREDFGDFFDTLFDFGINFFFKSEQILFAHLLWGAVVKTEIFFVDEAATLIDVLTKDVA